jgi:quercetin dioxygenase-like cupin family protein
MTVTFTPRERIETHWVMADQLRFLGRQPGTETWLIEVETPPGSGTPPHTHASPEVFIVTEGSLTLRSFGPDGPTVWRMGPGESLAIEARAPHNYANESDAPVRFLVLLEQSLIDFFREIGRPLPPDPGAAPDMAAILAAMARHDITLLSPIG